MKKHQVTILFAGLGFIFGAVVFFVMYWGDVPKVRMEVVPAPEHDFMWVTRHRNLFPEYI